jgi:chitinase
MFRLSRRLSRLALVAAAGAVVPTAAAIVTGGTPASACLYSATTHSCGTQATFKITPTQATTPTGVGVSFTAYYTALTSKDVTTRTTFTMDGAPCTANVCTPATAGTHVVNASYPGWNATATITAEDPGLLWITPQDADTVIGQAVTYTVQSVRDDGTIIGDATSAATVKEDGVVCPNAVCPADTLGPHFVQAWYGGLTDFVTLNVLTGQPARLTVSSSAGPLAPGSSGTFTAEAYDAAGDDLGDVTSTASFTINPDGTCANNQCTPANPGPHTVIATLGSATGSLDVSVVSPPTVQVGNKVTWEGNRGHHVVRVPITLSATATSPVAIQWTTEDGTATAGSDYLARSGTVTIQPGYRSVTVPVTILGDKVKEANETLQVVITGASGATATTPIGTVIIKNDD